MAKKDCTKQPPTISINAHAPANGWREHADVNKSVSAPTELEAFVKAFSAVLEGWGYANTPLVVGWFSEMINRLPIEVRRQIAASIVLGGGMEVKPLEGGKVLMRLYQKYPPLPQEPPQQTTASGLVIPKAVPPEDLWKNLRVT